MQAVRILADEHKAIESVLDSLGRLMDVSVRTDSLDAASASEIVEYLELAVDGSHQDKEELVVFPRLLKRTRPVERRLVERLARQHEDERRTLRELRGNLEGASYGDSLSRDFFVVHARCYRAHLSEHLFWEDELLLPLASEHLAEWEDEEILAAYQAVEARYFTCTMRGPGERLECICACVDRAEQGSARAGIPRAAERRSA